MQPLAADGRLEFRAPVAMKGKLLIIGGKGVDIAVTDLTIFGCSIIKPPVELRKKQVVSIKLEYLDYVKGIVRWSSQDTAGIEFDRPLYAPVAEHLQKVYLR